VSDLAGQKFGRWLVLERAPPGRAKASRWLCRCDCGTEKVLHRHNLVGGRTLSCGCANDRSLEERFWEKVERRGPDECWPWLGSTAGGYGRLFSMEGGLRKVETASRLSYEIARGPIPKGVEVLHECDNPPCVNPKHLHLGMHTDNMREASERARFKNHVRGSRHHNAVMTVAKARAVRRKHTSGETIRGLARHYGVSRTTIKRIVEGITWSGRVQTHE